MTTAVIGIGDCHISADRAASLVTYALGSCIAVVIHDALAGVGGLLHFQLPESSLDPSKAERNPFLFADTGIPLLFRNAYQLGADKKRLAVTVAGGAQMVDPHGTFSIGKRNTLAMKKILWKAGVLVQSEHLGGTVSRTVRLEIKTGQVLLREAGHSKDDTSVLPSGSEKRNINGVYCFDRR